MKADREVTEAYLEKMEENSEEIKSVAEYHEVLKEEAMVEMTGALMEWYGDQHLPVKH
jgi:hypothetical protein